MVVSEPVAGGLARRPASLSLNTGHLSLNLLSNTGSGELAWAEPRVSRKKLERLGSIEAWQINPGPHGYGEMSDETWLGDSSPKRLADRSVNG